MPKPHSSLVRDYYAQHSVITDPGGYASLFDPLPRNIPVLVKVVQGLLLHLLWAKSYHVWISEERRHEIYLRSIPEMLERILALDSSPLWIPRPTDERLIGICRDFGVLLVSILRHQGVPARLRVGFAGYFRSPELRFWDHRIAEYWDEQRERWILVDPQIDDIQRQTIGLDFDPLNITADSPFHLAGDVWRQCRAGKGNAQEYGDSPEDRGMPPIRYALLHDLDALNKVELVGFDAWHTLIDKPEEELAEEERAFLDQAAEATIQVDSNFARLRALYNTSAYGQTVQARLSSLRA